MDTAVILAAGQGRKMWPYSATRNKCLLPIANQPLICRTVSMLEKLGIKRIAVVTGYRPQGVRNALRGHKDLLFVESKGCGTASSLLSAWDAVGTCDLLVLYGDVLVAEEDVRELLGRAKAAQSPAALVRSLGQEPPGDWLCAQVSGDVIEYVLGHPRDSVSHRFCGAFALPQSFIPYLRSNPGRMSAVQVAMMAPDEGQLEDSLQLAIEDGLKVAACESKSLFCDLDKPWHILEANSAWLKYEGSRLESDRIGKGTVISDGATIEGRIVTGSDCMIGPGVFVEGDLWLGDNSTITQGAIIESNVAIGRRCTVRRYAQIESGTSVGDDGFVGHCAEIGGVFFRRAWAYHYGEYWGVIGECCDLGAATVCGTLRFDDAQTVHRVDGRREIPRTGANATYLGDYVRTGVNTIIMPGVKVGPYSVLGAGTIVSEDVAEKTLIYVRQEHEVRSWGPEKYGW